LHRGRHARVLDNREKVIDVSALRLIHPKANADALVHFFLMLRQRKDLVLALARRDILDRYAGQVFGGIWAVANPLILMSVYVFAFTVLFKGRVGAEGSALEYTAYILVGLVPWVAMTEVIGRAPEAVTSNANLVRQIVFPNELLPLKIAFGALPTLVLGLAVSLVVCGLTGHASLGWALLPIPIICYFLMSTGFAYLLAAFGVFVRDMKEIVAVMLSMGLFLHPILYPPGVAPKALQLLFYFSPISYVLWIFRDAAFYGGVTEPWVWIAAVLLSLGIFALGFRVYTILQPSFGNAL
jgi:lipopolysaccharide transport system permease protein